MRHAEGARSAITTRPATRARYVQHPWLDSGQATDATVRANNKLLLETDTNRQAYIDNVLTPMVTALKGYPGLFAWEIFNEPEGMTSDNGGWTTQSCSGAGKGWVTLRTAPRQTEQTARASHSGPWRERLTAWANEMATSAVAC